MKHTIVVSMALAATMLIGCAEQNTITDPAMHAQSTEHGLQKSEVIGENYFASRFEIDQVVADQTTGETFRITGQISCVYTALCDQYAFSTIVDLQAENTDPSGGQKKLVASTKNETKGVVNGPFQAELGYDLAGNPEGSMLFIQYSLSDEMKVDSIRLVLSQNRSL